MNNKRIGIFAVSDKNKDLTKRMTEDARYNLTHNKLSEADEDLNLDDTNPDETNPDPNAEGGLTLPPETDPNAPAEDEDALDLDALADDSTGNSGSAGGDSIASV